MTDSHLNFLTGVDFLIGAENPNVVSVFLNKGLRVHTTHSWDFLGLERKIGGVGEASVWKKSLGEDIIIANMDGGKMDNELLYAVASNVPQ